MGRGQRQVSLNELVPRLERDAEGNVLPARFAKFSLSTSDALRILKPYFSVRFMDQVKAVVPLAAYLALFQILFLRHLVEDSWTITGGLFAVIVGLMFFMEGLKLGLMPLGTVIGSTLPITVSAGSVGYLAAGYKRDLCRTGNRGAQGGRAERDRGKRALFICTVKQLFGPTGAGDWLLRGRRRGNGYITLHLRLEFKTADLFHLDADHGSIDLLCK